MAPAGSDVAQDLPAGESPVAAVPPPVPRWIGQTSQCWQAELLRRSGRVGGPEQVLAYLSRYTHRVAISNHRLISADADTVAFRWKDYRIKRGDRMKVMCLPTGEFIRRFLIHVLPSGFHRIRHTGFLANGIRRDRIAMIRRLLDREPEPDQMAEEEAPTSAGEQDQLQPCPKCGGPMRIIETFLRGQLLRSRAPPWEEAALSTLTPDRATPEEPDQSLRPVHQNQRGKSTVVKEIEADR